MGSFTYYYESDLYLLKQLFFPQARLVALLDPEGWVKPNMKTPFFRINDQSSVKALSEVESGLVLINMTNIPVKRYPVQDRAVAGILSFAKKGETYQNFTIDRFHYVLNNIETLRWVFSNNLLYPHFLNYYDSWSEYGNLFKGFCYLSGAFRQMRWLADGYFEVLHPSGLFFDNLSSGPYQGFTLFTKDMFYKGVALLQLVASDKVHYYAKIPVTDEGDKRLSSEHSMLKSLENQSFRNLRLPYAESESNLLLLSNAMNFRHKSFPKWKKHHFKALGEYTRTFAQESSIEEFLRQEHVLEKLASIKTAIARDELPKGLGPTNTAMLYQQLVAILNNLPMDQKLILSLVHGDFTEENLSIEDDQLVILDWEDARFGWPALGDVFDFITFRIEEEGPPDLASFQDEWRKLKTHEAFRVLVSEFAPNPILQFRVFWFTKVLFYIWNSLFKEFLPYYINWRLYWWRQMLEAYQNEADWLDVPAPNARVTVS